MSITVGIWCRPRKVCARNGATGRHPNSSVTSAPEASLTPIAGASTLPGKGSQRMTTQNRLSPGRRLRDLMAEPGIMVCPGVYDGFSVRLVEQLGFKTASISGAGLSETNLGWADVGIMGYEENVHASGALAACCDIPLSADGDTGYGNAVNVYFA